MGVRFAPGGALYDVTPVENIFIETMMGDAPGDFVKVYLYGLMLCYRDELATGGAEQFALALDMRAEQVRAAFGYWEGRGALKVLRAEPLEVEYANLKQQYTAGPPVQRQEVDGEFMALSEQLTAMFADRRTLNHNEMRLARAWLDELGLDAAAIVLLVRMCMDEKGANVSFHYIDAVMQERAQRGETALEDVENYLKRKEAAASGAAQILERWNIRRLPSDDEMALYRKWTHSWGLEHGALLEACARMTWAAYPSFALLDGQAQALYEAGACTAAQAGAYYAMQEDSRDTLKRYAKALGLPGSAWFGGALPEHIQSWTQAGFAQDTILSACYYLNRTGRGALTHLERLMEEWTQLGLFSRDQAERWIAARDQTTQAVGRWLARWGITRAPTQGEAQVYHIVNEEWKLEQGVIDRAVEDAVGARYPVRYVYSILKRYHEGGASGAQAYDAARQGAQTNAAPGTPEEFAQDYTDIFSPEAMP